MPQPQKPLGEGHTPHTLNMAGGSAVEGEGIVGSHIGEMIGVGSESDGQGWDCIVRVMASNGSMFRKRNLRGMGSPKNIQSE